jgi:hypothetical protein
MKAGEILRFCAGTKTMEINEYGLIFSYSAENKWLSIILAAPNVSRSNDLPLEYVRASAH